MRADVANSRIVAATSAPITYTSRDHQGEPTTPAGTVTVAVTDSQGDAVTAGAVSTSGNVSTSTLPIASTAAVDRLTAVWSDDGTEVATTVHDVVGGVYVTVADIRDQSKALKSATAHSAAALIAARTEVEYLFERATHRAFVPRFTVDILEGTGGTDLALNNADLREVVWAQYWNGSAWTAIVETFADIAPDDAGIARLTDTTWPTCRVKVGYRYGFDTPPADLVDAAVKAIEHRRHADKSGIPDRAISIQGTEVGNVTLATPGLGMWVTALPAVDEVLKGYRFTRPGIA